MGSPVIIESLSCLGFFSEAGLIPLTAHEVLLLQRISVGCLQFVFVLYELRYIKDI